jgi:hypothetical protein
VGVSGNNKFDRDAPFCQYDFGRDLYDLNDLRNSLKVNQSQISS